MLLIYAALASIRPYFLYFPIFSQNFGKFSIFSLLWFFTLKFDDLVLKRAFYASTQDTQGLIFSCRSNLVWRLEFDNLGLCSGIHKALFSIFSNIFSEFRESFDFLTSLDFYTQICRFSVKKSLLSFNSGYTGSHF